jgi:hypothetical protein
MPIPWRTQQQDEIRRLRRQLAAATTQAAQATAAASSAATAAGVRVMAAALAWGEVPAAVLLGGTRDVAITWPAGALPDAAYRVDLVPISGGLGVTSLAVVAGTRTKDGVTIRVTAAGLAVAVGARFVALAVR